MAWSQMASGQAAVLPYLDRAAKAPKVLSRDITVPGNSLNWVLAVRGYTGVFIGIFAVYFAV